MQTKTTCDEKIAILFKQKQDLQGTFLWWKDFEQKMFKISILVNSISWNCIQYIFICRFAAFLIRQEYLKHGSNNIFKIFLHFFTKNIWEKVDINFESLNRIQ